MGKAIYIKINKQKILEEFKQICIMKGLKQQFVLNKALEYYVEKNGDVEWAK